MTAEKGGCEIRPMKNTDASAAAELERQCFSDPWGAEEFEAIEESCLDRGFCAWRKGRMEGYLLLRLVAGEGEILRVGVDPAARRQGMGRLLVEAAKAAAGQEKAEKVFLEVRAGNEAAIALYCRAGFVPCGVRKNYYRLPDEDAVLMEWTPV